ncbi:MAG TPA: nucleoid-associated protein [Clostridia bacterium]|nr:nucleoid-associated protein [Clostridia bacterium]
MNLANIEIHRVVAHEVVRASQIAERPPILSDDLVVLDPRGKALVGKRLIDTVASGSHCVDVTVDDATAGSPFDRATAMLYCKDAEFLDQSKHLATSLSSAQTAGPIKSGSAMFVQGTCCADGRQSRFLAIIKADSDQALYKRVNGENITLTYVSDMLLGESQRLIKIAFFIEEGRVDGNENPTGPRQPEDFSVKVFDHLMQTSGDGDAAAYFYRTFLRCQLSHNSARQTKQFYEVVRSFIDKMPVSQTERVAFYGDLISYFRQNRTTLEPRTFAQDVLPQAHQDAFLKVCREANITQAISKDLQLLKGKLRRQSVKFSSNVTLYASADVFRDAVKITGTTSDGWTELKIRGTIEAIP